MKQYNTILFALTLTIMNLTANVLHAAATSSVSSSSSDSAPTPVALLPQSSASSDTSSSSSSRTISAENTQKMWYHFVRLVENNDFEQHLQPLKDLAAQGQLDSNSRHTEGTIHTKVGYPLVHKGMTPLECLINLKFGWDTQYTQLFTLFLDNGADLGLATAYHSKDPLFTLFHLAASPIAFPGNDSVKMMQTLIKRRPDLINVEDSQKRTPLIYAAGVRPDNIVYMMCSYWQYLKIETLINNDADIHQIDCNGKKALDYVKIHTIQETNVANLTKLTLQRAQQRHAALIACQSRHGMPYSIIDLIALCETGLSSNTLKEQMTAQEISDSVITDLIGAYIPKS